MSADAALLRQFVTEKSEGAFAELVRQHLGLVYHTARRHLPGDEHAAEDVAQAVFVDLARKAGALVNRPSLAGWLHTSARYAALQHRRTEQRRRNREQEAQIMQEISHDSEPPLEWESVRGVIDDALAGLSTRDREAVLMRFFEGRDFADVGARLALSPQGARSCVDRALTKMQARLTRRGVSSTVAALAVALSGHAAAGAPQALTESVTRAALAAAGKTAAATFSLGCLTFARIVPVALATSLALNAVLAGRFWTDDAVRTTFHDRLPKAPAATSIAVSIPPAVAQEPTTDPVEVGRRLRAQGFPDRVVAAGVRSAVCALPDVRAEIEARSNASRIRRWNPSPRPSLAVAAGLEPPAQAGYDWESTLEAQRTAAVFAELGLDPSGRPIASLYRNLPADKAVAIQRIEDDYRRIREAGVVRVGDTSTVPPAVNRLVATEFEADIRTVLTPTEAATYFRYHSEAGREVLAVLDGLTVSDRTHAAIADAALMAERAKWDVPDDPAHSALLQIELVQAYRRELGDELFLDIAPRLEGGTRFAVIDPIYRDAGLSLDARADLFLTLHAALQAARVADPTTVAARAYAALTTKAGLNAQQIAAFDATPVGGTLKKQATTAAGAPSP